jgi:flagellar export protein FliJ
VSTDRARLARRLVRIREIAERQEATRARTARERLAAAEEELVTRRGRTDQLSAEIRQRTARGVTAAELLGFAALADAARRGEAVAEAARAAAAAQERKAAEALLAAIRERQAAEKLRERAEEAAAAEERAREQRLLDEFGNRRPPAEPPAD